MNINIEIYKNRLCLSDQQTVNIIKKARYILSKLVLHGDNITFSLGNILKDKQSNKLIFKELKKLTNMAISLVQVDKLGGFCFCVDSLFGEEDFINIIDLAKFSGITNKIHIFTKNIEDDAFTINFPELNIEKCEKSDIMFTKRFILDQKQEFICREDI